MPTLRTARTRIVPVKHVAAFGAALATLAVGHGAPVEAAIVDLTPILHSQSVTFSGHGYINFGSEGNLYQWNDGVGKSLKVTSFASYYGVGIIGLRRSYVSNTLSSDRSWRQEISPLGPTVSGTRTFGFLTGTGQVGWFKVDFGGFAGAVHYLAGAYNDTPGGSIHVGSTPEPATTSLLGLSLLALGAKGVRRLRNERKRQADSAAS